MRIRVVCEWWFDNRYVIEVKPTFWSAWRRADDQRYASKEWCISDAKKIGTRSNEPVVVWISTDNN